MSHSVFICISLIANDASDLCACPALSLAPRPALFSACPSGFGVDVCPSHRLWSQASPFCLPGCPSKIADKGSAYKPSSGVSHHWDQNRLQHLKAVHPPLTRALTSLSLRALACKPGIKNSTSWVSFLET